jgi:hypothetical protein
MVGDVARGGQKVGLEQNLQPVWIDRTDAVHMDLFERAGYEDGSAGQGHLIIVIVWYEGDKRSARQDHRSSAHRIIYKQ